MLRPCKTFEQGLAFVRQNMSSTDEAALDKQIKVGHNSCFSHAFSGYLDPVCVYILVCQDSMARIQRLQQEIGALDGMSEEPQPGGIAALCN